MRVFKIYTLTKLGSPFLSLSNRITTLAVSSPTNLNQNKHEFDIVIVGSGLVGAAMACALGKAPHLNHLKIALTDSSSLEPSPTHTWSNRVVALGQSAVRVLETLDVWDRIPKKFKWPYQTMKVYDATINAKVEFHADDYKFSSLGWIVDVPTLKSTLLESLRSSPVRLFPQTELYSLTYPSSSDSSTSCHFLPELHLNPNQSMQASLIIGADGIHSKVRQLSSISTFGHSYHQMGLVATLHVDTMANTTAWQRFLPTGPLALLPISDHEASLVWTLPQHHAKKILTLPSDQFIALLNAALTYPLEEVHIMLENSLNLNLVEEVAWRDSVYEQQPGFDFSQFPPQILDLVKDSRAAFPLSIRHVDQYTGERTVLVGDAAHVTHPLAGQGFNLGLADVTSLTRALDTAAGVGQDLGDPDVLGEYTRDRYFRNTLMLSLCDTLLNIFGVSSSPFVWLRKWGIHQFQSSHTLKALAIQCVSNWDGRLTKTQHRGIS